MPTDYQGLFLNGNQNALINRQPAAVPQVNTNYNPYADQWKYTDTGAKNVGYLPRIQASDIVNGKFVGGDNYGQFSAANMGAHGDNYQTSMNPDGTFRLGVKTDKTNRLDTTYVKQGDSWVPQAQANAHWDTGTGGFGGTLSKILSATPAGALMNSPLGQKLAPIASIASMFVPGMQPFALAMNAMNAGMHGDLKGLAMSALPGMGQLAGQGSMFANLANGVSTAGQAYGGVKNLQNGNLLAGLGGLAGAAGAASNMSGNSDFGSMFGNASKGLGIANNLQHGNVMGAVSGGLGLGGYGQAASALNGINSLYNLTQQRGTPLGPVRTVQRPMMFGNPTGRG